MKIVFHLKKHRGEFKPKAVIPARHFPLYNIPASLLLSSLTMEWVAREEWTRQLFTIAAFFSGWLPIISAFFIKNVINDIWWRHLMEISEGNTRDKWMRSLWSARNASATKQRNNLIKNYLVHHHNLNQTNFFMALNFDTDTFITFAANSSPPAHISVATGKKKREKKKVVKYESHWIMKQWNESFQTRPTNFPEIVFMTCGWR